MTLVQNFIWYDMIRYSILAASYESMDDPDHCFHMSKLPMKGGLAYTIGGTYVHSDEEMFWCGQWLAFTPFFLAIPEERRLDFVNRDTVVFRPNIVHCTIFYCIYCNSNHFMCTVDLGQFLTTFITSNAHIECVPLSIQEVQFEDAHNHSLLIFQKCQISPSLFLPIIYFLTINHGGGVK